MYKSFSFTIRPRNGFPKTLDHKVIDWAKKQDGAFLCFEKDGIERHIHGQVWHEPREKGTINRSLERLCCNNVDEWDAAQSIVLRRGTKIAYNDDFITEYLAKEDNVILNIPPEDTSLFYPSLDEQNKVKDQANATDPQYHKYLYDFHEYQKEKNLPEVVDNISALKQVADFLSYKIYVEKTYKVIKHKRDRNEITTNIMNYIRSRINPKEFMSESDWQQYIHILEDNETSLTEL